MNSLLLTQLVVAKVCHDLATPLNSLSLGLEMAGDGESFSADTYDLLMQSAGVMKSRLKFFRSLFSSGSGTPTFPEVCDILKECAQHNKVSFSLIAPNLIEAPAGVPARLILALAFMGLEGLPRGGKLTISIDPENNIISQSDGDLAQLRPGYEDILTGVDASLESQTSRSIFPYFAKMLAQECNKQIHTSSQPGFFEIKAIGKNL